jgi:hypothetical protein
MAESKQGNVLSKPVKIVQGASACDDGICITLNNMQETIK